MGKGRLEAFSDGVIAIIITIMVLELKVPHGDTWEALKPLIPVFVSYVLSFVNVAIYWNNHHHLLHAARHVSGGILWANMLLLFWLSLVPFVTGWMGENSFHEIPVAAYALVLLMSAVSYSVLVAALIRRHGRTSQLATAIGPDYKGKVSLAAYAVAIPSAFLSEWIALALITAVALLWLVPDRRIERAVETPVGAE